ncbi:hypothetical protein [Bacteroides sp. 519]|uniref:hypothetical protein n=1 Tax=Bacteroides sp. 519 TaxID=2302937 RepID=UPI0013D43D81|nr:hypothetical protein [Bacteroides sp. 519]NDV58397.1 hypothetical protein [Bacteroides sp. 519]
MTYAELQARKAQLIAYLEEEVYDEKQLIKYEAIIMGFEPGKVPHLVSPNYPYAPNEEQLKKIAAKAIEDDKNGLFIDGPTYAKQLRARIEARRKKEEEIRQL